LQQLRNTVQTLADDLATVEQDYLLAKQNRQQR
jgi:hypothetical protein